MNQVDKFVVEDSLVKHARDLVEQLENGDSTDAMQTISNLHQQRDSFLFEEVGKLTRSLHDSMQNFIESVNVGQNEAKEISRISDASDRLHYVIERSEQAANKTMDMVEETVPVSSDLNAQANEINKEWTRFIRKEMKPDEFRVLTKQITSFLESAVNGTQTIDSNLSSIMLAQDFQDLTGQVIKRVITLIQEVEERLVDLVKMAGTVDYLNGVKREPSVAKPNENASSEAEGPIINPEERSDVVSGQDDVDDLLSSLGF